MKQTLENCVEYFLFDLLIVCFDYETGGGVATINAGTGCAIFRGRFFRAENKFWGIIFGKITGTHKFWGVILENELIRVSTMISFSLTWLKFWMAVAILGYTFSMARKFWGIVFAKIYKF